MRPLTVAIVAAALFVVVIAADSAMNRTYVVEAETDDGYQEAGRGENVRAKFRYPSAPEIAANRSDTLRFRLVADNGFPWPLDETYRVYVNGQEVASGDITASARATGEAMFTIEASRLLSPYGPAREGQPEVVFTSFEVRIGDDEMVYANVGIREVSA